MLLSKSNGGVKMNVFKTGFISLVFVMFFAFNAQAHNRNGKALWQCGGYDSQANQYLYREGEVVLERRSTSPFSTIKEFYVGSAIYDVGLPSEFGFGFSLGRSRWNEIRICRALMTNGGGIGDIVESVKCDLSISEHGKFLLSTRGGNPGYTCEISFDLPAVRRRWSPRRRR